MVKRERWKNRYIWVERDNKGRLKTWRKVKNSRLNKETVTKIYQRNKTFNTNKIYQEHKLKNVIEKSILVESRPGKRVKPIKRPYTNSSLRYVVELRLKNGTVITAGSQNLNSTYTLDKNSRQAINRAWDNVLAKLSYELTGNYDKGEGQDIFDKEVKSVREGWVRYDKIP